MQKDSTPHLDFSYALLSLNHDDQLSLLVQEAYRWAARTKAEKMRDGRFKELDQAISDGGGNDAFEPRIEIATGLWTWMLPGGTREAHGSVSVVPRDVAIRDYAAALAARFRLIFSPADIACPERVPSRPSATPATEQGPALSIAELLPLCAALKPGESMKVFHPYDSTRQRFSNTLRSRLAQHAATRLSKWSISGIYTNDEGFVPGEEAISVQKCKAAEEAPAEQAQPSASAASPQPASITTDELTFLELALKFFADEDALSEEEWRRINDRELPRLAAAIIERRSIARTVEAFLGSAPPDIRNKAEQMLVEYRRSIVGVPA